MTEFEKMMKDMANEAMKNAQGVKVDLGKMKETQDLEDKEGFEDAMEAVVGLLGGLFSGVLEGLDEEMSKETPVNKPKQATQQTTQKAKKVTSLYEELVFKKSLGAKYKVTDLDKETLTTLVVKEKVSLDKVAELFDTTVEFVKYGMTLTGVKEPKEKDLLEETLQYTCGLGDKELNDYFKGRLELLSIVKDSPLKEVIVKDLVLSLAYIGYTLNLTHSENQLMLVKLDKESNIVVNVYNLPVEFFLAKYDLSKIKWNF